MTKTHFERFYYQCKLAGMTFSDFCELSEISPSASRDLLDSKGGRKYLVDELGKLREESITIGDVMQVLISHGYEVEFSGGYLGECIDGVASYSQISDDYKERQEQLGNILLGVEQ